MYDNYISSCRLVAMNRLGVFEVNEAPGTFSSVTTVSDLVFITSSVSIAFLTRGFSRLFPAVFTTH